MPAELVHAVAVASVVVLLHLPADEEEGGRRRSKVKCATTVGETFQKGTATSKWLHLPLPLLSLPVNHGALHSHDCCLVLNNYTCRNSDYVE